MARENKPTFKELLDQHRITYFYFYAHCLRVPTTEIDAIYRDSVATRGGIEKAIAFLNEEVGTNYTLEDIHMEKIY